MKTFTDKDMHEITSCPDPKCPLHPRPHVLDCDCDDCVLGKATFVCIQADGELTQEDRHELANFLRMRKKRLPKKGIGDL